MFTVRSNSRIRHSATVQRGLLMLLHGQKPLSVYAVLAQRKPDVYPRVDDDATIVVEYPGCTVQIMASWCWPTNRKDMYVYGTKGSVFQLTPTRMETLIDGRDSGAFDAPGLESPYNDSLNFILRFLAMAELMQASLCSFGLTKTFRFLRAVVRDEITLSPYDLSSLENNLMVVRILDAARRSARTGKRMTDF